MMYRFRRTLFPALDDDSQDRRTAYWLYSLLYFIFIVLLMLMLTTLFSTMTAQDKAGFTAFNISGLALCTIFYVLARRGQIRLAALGVVACVYLGSALPTVFMFGTIRAPNITGLFVLVPLAALLLGKRAIYYVVALCIATVLTIYALETSGAIQPNVQTAAGIDIILIGLVVNAVLLLTALNNADDSAAQARRAAAEAAAVNRDLIQSQSELQTIKAQLEERVLQRTAQLDDANRMLRMEIAERVQSELRFRSLAEHSPDLIYILDLPSQQWVYVNRQELFDHPLGEPMAQATLSAWIHPDDLPGVTVYWQRLAQDAAPNGGLEFRLRRLDGEWEWLHSREAVLLREPGRLPEQVLVTMTVITPRKLYEEDLKAAHQRAELATRAKSDFLANMSHEIRTPLNAVIGMASLLNATPLTAEQREYTDVIRSSSEALLAVISDILDFSKIETPTFRLEIMPWEPAGLLAQIVDLVAVEVNRKGLELICDLDPSVPACIETDGHRLRQILLNLVGNAVKFTATGEIVLSVRAEPLADDALRLIFTVRDTGIGIPADKQKTIFEQFAQADTSHTRRFGGAGLGLAISRRLAMLMGGDIAVESEPGAGATFCCHIRVQGCIASTPAPRLHARAGQAVLLVNPNVTMRSALMKQLARWGLHPRAAASQIEAQQLLAEDASVDLVLFDHSLVTPESVEAGSLFGAMPMWVLAPPQERLLRTQLAGRPHTHFLTKPCTPLALWNSLDATAPAPRETLLQPTVAAPAAPAPVSVLVVEDNLVNQKVVMRVLERLGCIVSIAQNGVEAVAAVHSGRFAVVFMDIQMPEMDGLEATRAIRQLPAPVEQPYIIALTAAVAEVDRARCLAAGMNDFVSKPARTEEISAALHRAMSALNQPAPAYLHTV